MLKISPYRVDRSYESESHNLDLLRSVGIPTPRVYQCVTGTLDDPNSYLLMEFMPGVDLNIARHQASAEQSEVIQRELAEMVLAIHQNTGPAYGRVIPNGISASETWPEFFRDVYGPTWQEMQKLTVLPIKTRKLLDKLHERLDPLIAHSDVPRLVHGDLWASNLLCAG